MLRWGMLACCLAWMAAGTAMQAWAKPLKVVLIAGKKSHGPGDHEYEKGLRLLKRCLETSPNLKNVRAEVHTDGWPQDARALDDADTIVLFSDGSDHGEANHPLLHGDRLETLGRAMKRGAGLVALHYTVFVPTKRGGPEFLEWIGGYFDYENGAGQPPWVSKIRAAATTPVPATPSHPVSRGLKPFPLREEYYYNIRFRPNDPRRVPILNTAIPDEPQVQTVAWAVERADGGRGFGFTGGHFHSNWQVENFRKMVLNAIVWTAKGNVPSGGVQSRLPEEDRPIRALILTGHHHPAHDWRATTEAMQQVLGRDSRFQTTVMDDPERLATADLSGYDLLIQNYCNWERPTLSEKARASLLRFARSGRGLILLHFANGAWLDWKDYRRLSRRVWIEGTSSHDAYGPFRVNIRNRAHPITQSVEDYDTIDELYCRQQGDLPIAPLVTAKSKITGQDEPLAYAYSEGKGRIFQLLLGHDARAVRAPGTAALLRRGAAWVAGREPIALPVATINAARVVAGKFGSALDPADTQVSAPPRPEYRQPPLTVECWAKLRGKSGFNILAASGPKESSAHWELYTWAGTGAFCAYLPGLTPDTVNTKTDITDNRWHYVAMTYEPGRVRLYVDGRLAADQAVTIKPGNVLAGPLTFGSYPPQGIGCDGVIDEVHITQGIRDVARVPAAPMEADAQTVGLWRFDRSENGAFADESRLKNAAQDANPFVAAGEAALPRPTSGLPYAVARQSVKSHTDWMNVGNDKGGMRYSPLSQINRDNVKNLEVAWTYRAGDADPKGNTTIECTPIVVEGVMYLTTVRTKIVALEAATGREIWKFDPFAGPKRPGVGSPGVNRGVAWWSDGKRNGARRILAGLGDGRLLSLDARTGQLDPNFGKHGELDLRLGIERDISRYGYSVTSAPAVFENNVIIGVANSEGQPGAPGDVRAFDARTGKQVWRFRTVPAPGEFGNETWEGDGWKDRSGTNPWSGFTVDAKRGIVFCGTGSASSDFYGADRKGANLFANCTLALDARTGKRLWHFQTVHHDLWDHDNPCPPVLVTVRRNGKRIDAAVQATKTGYLFLFDRVTGRPLFDVREVPAPPSDVPGERAHPTQPQPVKPPALSPTVFTDADVTNISPEAAASVREQLKTLRYGKPYLPPSVEGTVVMPGFHGGANWSGASFDPTTGLLYINTVNAPYICKVKANSQGGYDFQGYAYFNDRDGYPAVKPPWGLLTAVNLNTGEFAWQVPLGEFPELAAKGIRNTGTENFGGTIVTAGGLVFIGGTKDEKFRAFDKATGQVLWETQLPSGGYANPSAYAVNGRQYVVIAAGGGGKLRTAPGDAFIAFALPDSPR